MANTWKNIPKDTLQKPNGKWDYRKLSVLLFSILGAVSGLFVVVSDYFLNKEINPYAIGVVGLFLGMAGGQTVVATWNKKIDTNLGIDQSNEINENETIG